MAEIFDESGTQCLVGYVLDVGGEDGCGQAWLDVTDCHLNRLGVLHGGISAMLLDNALGVSASMHIDPAGKAPFSTVSLTVNYLAPGREGRVTAVGRVTGGGQRTLFVEGQLTHEDGTVIATAIGVFKHTPPRKTPA